jgi:hypothetical protein
MIDVSQVTRFAARLNLPVIEEPWTDEWSRKVADDWRAGVPVLTGEYKDSIHVTDDGAEADAKHAVFVERGTASMAPQPALVPAINRNIKSAAADAGRLVIRQLT